MAAARDLMHGGHPQAKGRNMPPASAKDRLSISQELECPCAPFAVLWGFCCQEQIISRLQDAMYQRFPREFFYVHSQLFLRQASIMALSEVPPLVSASAPYFPTIIPHYIKGEKPSQMENSNFEDEDVFQCQYNNKTQEDFDKFVSNLSEEDYKLMRDNNLLGNPGEYTEEELLRRLQWIKTVQDEDENTDSMVHKDINYSSAQIFSQPHTTTTVPDSTLPTHQLDAELSSDVECCNASVLPWLSYDKEIGNMRDEERANLFWGESSLEPNPNSDDFRVSMSINFNAHENPDQEIECATSTRLLSEENLEDSQRQVQILPLESMSTRSSMSEQGTTEILTEVPSTRGQRRARSRSPENRRVRSRIENRSGRSRINDSLESFHYHLTGLPMHTLEDEDEDDTFFITQQEETLRQETTALESQNSGLLASCETTNTIQGSHSPDENSSEEFRRLPQAYPTILYDSELEVDLIASSQKDSEASISQLTSERQINTVNLESEVVQDTLSPFEQAEAQSSNEYSFNSLLTSLMYNPSVLTESTVRNDTNNLVDDDEVGTSVSSPSQPTEGIELSNIFTISGLSSTSTTEENHTHNFYSNTTPVSNFSFDYESSYSYSTIPMTSSNNDYSNNHSLMFGENENILTPLSPGAVTEILRERPMSPMFDDSDSWSSLNLDEFLLADENDEHQSTGLTKAQIDNLDIRPFGEFDALKTCCICITEFIEGNKICILPCLHEYHLHCINRWLLQNITCPICRRNVVDIDE
ncbi:E3 ubiquitin-protein ligase RLIM-like [Sorex fumeus]|uniref:E3 ubiquitin-protein ligase RLIM-like n=1 Tax=Sorex fumeus TaxID=62283 RepID=UPI0024ACEC8B|nr:E3 ubiquitin-protein ligase RLIM-like [Sorex fumeus]